MKRIKVIYGDKITERYISSDYASAWERAREEAKKRNTYVRCFACTKM